MGSHQHRTAPRLSQSDEAVTLSATCRQIEGVPMVTELGKPLQLGVDTYSLYATDFAVRKSEPGPTFAFTEHGNSGNVMAEISYAQCVFEQPTHTGLHPQTILLSSYRRTRWIKCLSLAVISRHSVAGYRKSILLHRGCQIRNTCPQNLELTL